jgi:hypothetical protein
MRVDDKRKGRRVENVPSGTVFEFENTLLLKCEGVNDMCRAADIRTGEIYHLMPSAIVREIHGTFVVNN